MSNQLRFYWHIHHDVLLEPLTEPLKNRIRDIKENKPKDEIKLRLKLLKPVKGKLPKELVEAEKKYDEAKKKYIEAWKKYDKTLRKYQPQIEKLHKKECPNCPWNGKTIF